MAEYLFGKDRVKPPGKREASFGTKKAVRAAEKVDGMKGVAYDVGAGKKGRHYAGRQFPEYQA